MLANPVVTSVIHSSVISCFFSIVTSYPVAKFTHSDAMLPCSLLLRKETFYFYHIILGFKRDYLNLLSVIFIFYLA